MSKLKSKSKASKKSKNSKQEPEAPTLSPKELSAQKRKAAKAKQELIQFTVTTIIGSAFLGVILGLVGGLKAGLGVGIGIPCIALSYKYPRQALWFFLLYLPINGTVTYSIGGGNPLFQLAKDAFYIPALIALIRDCQMRRKPIMVSEKLKTSLMILLACSILTLLFVNGIQQLSGAKGGKPFFQGVLGLKVLMGYIPLIVCAYYLIRTKAELLFATRMHTILAISCCVLGFIQYTMLETGKCKGTRGLVAEALFKATLDAKCFVGGALVYSPEVGMIRLPGTFVSPWHWAWFLIANSSLTFATAFSDPNFLWRVIGLVGMALVFLNAVISGQRIALALVPIVIVILLFLTGQVANLKRFIPVGVGLAILLSIGMAANPSMVQERVDSFTSRWEASPPQAFIQSQFEWAVKSQKNIFGQGLGKATNSTRIFGDTELVETYYPKILYEGGYPGLIAYIAWLGTLTTVVFKAYRSVKDKNLRSFGASFWVFMLLIGLNTYWYPLDTDPVAIYYWFFAGVVLKLPEIDKQEQEKRLAILEKDPEYQRQQKIKANRAARKAGKKATTPSS